MGSKDALVQRSLVVFKPDAVQRGVVGEILTRFEKIGLKIVGMKMVHPDKDHYYHHYETIGKMVSRRGEKPFNDTLGFIIQSPVIAMVLEGVEAVALIRKMAGATEPKAAAVGTIRGDYAHVSFAHADAKDAAIPNLIHASGDPEEAEQEIAHWFKKGELFNYETPNDKFVRL